MAPASRSPLLLLFVCAVSASFIVSFANAANMTSDECTSFVTSSLQGCTTYLGGSGKVAPDASCCQPVEKAITNATEFACICSLATNPNYGAMVTKALAIPQACNLPQNVTMSNCTGSSAAATSSTNTTNDNSSAYFLKTPGMASVLGFAVLSLILNQ